jgi:hypothetical protein
VGPIPITGIIFGTGLATTQRGCAIAIDSPLVAKGYDACTRTYLPTATVEAVTGLNWGRGFNWNDMYDASNCSLLIETYHRITGKKALDDCHDKYPQGTSYDNTFEKLVGRLSVTEEGAGCEYTVSGMQPLFSIFGNMNRAGQSGNLSGVNGDPNYPLGCQANWENTLCNRTVPETAEGLIGGRGVGIAGCSEDQNNGASAGDCAAVLFLNALNFGFDTNCDPVKFLQVAETWYGNEFEVKQRDTDDGETGSACDGFDGSLAVEVELNKGGGNWSIDYVKCIDVTFTAGYVTNVVCEMGNINGTKTCDPTDQFFWIQATGNPHCVGDNDCLGP